VKIVRNKRNFTIKKTISSVLSVTNYRRDAIKSAKHAKFMEKATLFAQSVQSLSNLTISQIIFSNFEQAKCNPNYQSCLLNLLQIQVLAQTSKKPRKMKVSHHKSIDNLQSLLQVLWYTFLILSLISQTICLINCSRTI
jgi:hypothetical protein